MGKFEKQDNPKKEQVPFEQSPKSIEEALTLVDNDDKIDGTEKGYIKWLLENAKSHEKEIKGVDEIERVKKYLARSASEAQDFQRSAMEKAIDFLERLQNRENEEKREGKKMDAPEVEKSDIAKRYREILQDNLGKIYEEKLRKLAGLEDAPAESVSPVRLWFFIEYWKLKYSKNKPFLLEVQESIKKICPELDNNEYHFDKPELDSEKSSSPEALESQLASYQKAKELLENKSCNEITIEPEKYRELQSFAVVIIDRVVGSGYKADHPMAEAFLRLVGLRALVVMEKITHFNEELHYVTGNRSDRSVEPGTVIEVTRPGLRGIYDGKIVRKAFVITAS